MDLKVNVEGAKATLELAGKLTVNTSPDLSRAIDDLPVTVCDIFIDIAEVNYVASAGLRVFVATEKLASKRGGAMHLLHPCNEVMEVLDMTGLAEVFTIER